LVPAGCAGPVRLGEGARRLRRGAGMVGGQGGAGRVPAGLTAPEQTAGEQTAAGRAVVGRTAPGRPGAGQTPDVRDAYEAAAAGWADGPERVYGPLARALIRAAPVPLAGGRILDLG